MFSLMSYSQDYLLSYKLSIILLVLRLINNDKEPFCSRSKSRKYNNSNKYVAIAERLTDVAFYIRGVS